MTASQLVQRIDRQAKDARNLCYFAFGLALIVAALLILYFAGSVIRGDFDAAEFNLKEFATVASWPTIVGRLVLRLGAVLIGLFAVQLTFGFGLYYARLASHLTMTANLILVADGDGELLGSLAATLLPTSIDFGRMPRSPVEHVLVKAVEAVGRSAPKAT